MIFPAIMAGVSLLSSLKGARQQKKLQQDMLNYQRSLRLDPVTGRFGQIGVNEGNVDLGAFGDLQSMFSGAAGDALGSLDFSGGIPQDVMSAFGALQSRLNPGVDPMLGRLFQSQQQAGGVAGQALGDLFGGNPQASLMAQLFQGAGGLAGQLGSSYEGVRDSTLANLRSAALPENQRAVDSTLTKLFSEGRLGSTGGANIIGRLAEAQNQQDLGFQLAAGQEGRAANQDVLSRFQSLFSGGQDLAGLDLERMNSAFDRFSGATNIGADLNNMAFGRTAGLENEGYQRLLDNFKSIVGLQSLPGELQNQRIQGAQGLLQGAGSIQDLVSQAFGDALGLANAKTNVRVAGAGLATNYVGSPQFSASPTADAIGSFASGMVRPGQFDIASIFANLGRRRTGQDPSSVFASLGIPTG